MVTEENMDGEGGNSMRNMSVQGMFVVKCELVNCVFSWPGHCLQDIGCNGAPGDGWVSWHLKISGAKKKPPMSKEG